MVLKVVSDNPRSDYRLINAVKVQQLIEKNMMSIEDVLSSLLSVAVIKGEGFNETFVLMQSKWHITESQKQQLFDLYQFVRVLEQNGRVEVSSWKKYRKVKEYLAYLKLLIQNNSPNL